MGGGGGGGSGGLPNAKLGAFVAGELDKLSQNGSSVDRAMLEIHQVLFEMQGEGL